MTDQARIDTAYSAVAAMVLRHRARQNSGGDALAAPDSPDATCGGTARGDLERRAS